MVLTAGDIVFVDTNTFLIATDGARRGHREARLVIGKAARAGVHLAVSGQILREYLVVATRPPKSNGLGLRVSDALANVDAFLKRTVFYEETEQVAARLRELIGNQSLCGTRIHDANIAATMYAHAANALLTENPADFEGLPDTRLLSLHETAKEISTLAD
jgi:predicted nucleic acid-binding protein